MCKLNPNCNIEEKIVFENNKLFVFECLCGFSWSKEKKENGNGKS